MHVSALCIVVGQPLCQRSQPGVLLCRPVQACQLFGPYIVLLVVLRCIAIAMLYVQHLLLHFSTQSTASKTASAIAVDSLHVLL